MARRKKKVSWNEQLLLELEELAEMLGKRFSDVVNEVVLLGLDAYKRKYADRLKRKEEEENQKKENDIAERYMRRIIFDWKEGRDEGWIPVM